MKNKKTGSRDKKKKAVAVPEKLSPVFGQHEMVFKTDAVTVERVKAEFLDDIFILPQDAPVYRMEFDGFRYYVTLDDSGAPSFRAGVTTIIGKMSPTSPYLLKWWCDQGYEAAKERLEIEAHYGTFMHILFGKILRADNVDISKSGLILDLMKYLDARGCTDLKIDFALWTKRLKEDVVGFLCWCQKYKIKPYAIEVTLSGSTHAGTIDLVAQATFPKGKKKAILVDFKKNRNAFFDDNIAQLEGYLSLWNEKYPDFKIEEIWNYGARDYRLPIGKTVDPFRFENQTSKKELRARWNHYLAMYRSEVPEFTPEPYSQIVDSVVNIKTDVASLIRVVDPLEFIGTIEIEKAEKPKKEKPKTKKKGSKK